MVAALGIAAHQLVPLDQKGPAAAGAVLSGGLLPGHKVAFRIVDAAVVLPALLGLLQHHVLAALGAGHADLLEVGLSIFFKKTVAK